MYLLVSRLPFGDCAENLYLGHYHIFVTNDVSLITIHQIKGALLKDQYIFRPYLLCHGAIFFKIQAWETAQICCKLHKLDCNLLIIKDPSHEEWCMSCPVSQLLLEAFS